jgi:predicted nucleotidyltransferase
MRINEGRNIISNLAHIEQVQNITILLAVESGSRAWGFPSPDSDYDVRFVYVRKQHEYLKVLNKHDMHLNYSLAGELDFAGWDLSKALHLAFLSNAVFLEWLSSPIIYKNNGKWFKEVIPLVYSLFDYNSLLYHYYGIATKFWKKDFANKIQEGKEVNLKKYFYIIRPLYALEWLTTFKYNIGINDWTNCVNNVLPMQLSELRLGISLSSKIETEIDSLLERKRASSEALMQPSNPILDEWIVQMLEKYSGIQKPVPLKSHLINDVNRHFIKWVKEYDS